MVLPILSHARVDTSAPGLCLALRGNAFRIGAHYGVIAKLVESHGLPDATAGGSSASLTQFFIESVAINPYVERFSSDPVERRLAQALLLKTFPEFLRALADEPEILDAMSLISKPKVRAEALQIIEKAGKSTGLQRVLYGAKLYLTSGTFRKLLSLKSSDYFKALVNPNYLAYQAKTSEFERSLKNTTDPKKIEELKALIAYRKKESEDAITQLKDFKISEDPNAFFRNGILNASGSAGIFDRYASLVAGYNFFENDALDIQTFFKTCAKPSEGKTFDQLSHTHPICRTQFYGLSRRYLDNFKRLPKEKVYRRCDSGHSEKNNGCLRYRADDFVGQKLSAFVATAVVSGASAEKYQDLEKQYDSTVDPRFGERFTVEPKDLQIGYFSRHQDFDKALSRLRSGPIVDSSGRSWDFINDYKTQKAVHLGMISWREAMAISASEPGQAKPIRLAPANLNDKAYSFGGWVDQNPVHLLRGLGCEIVVSIITKSDAKVSFSEQVLRRLTPTMSGISDLTDSESYLGRPQRHSDWDRWRNPGNPESSDVVGFRASDAVVCTDWNDYDPFDRSNHLTKNMDNLFKVGYQAPIFIVDGVGADQPVRTWPNYQYINRTDNHWDPKLGRYEYQGCIPPVDESPGVGAG